jgi:plasmid stability protein
MKIVTMTVRGCPEGVHAALKESARAHRRSLNQEALSWLEKQAEDRPMSGRELAKWLREFNQGLTMKERLELAEAIEEAGRRMGRGQLH